MSLYLAEDTAARLARVQEKLQARGHGISVSRAQVFAAALRALESRLAAEEREAKQQS